MNSSIASFSEKIKHPLLKIYSGLTAMALILLITVTLTILATLAVPEAKPVIRYAPGHPSYEVMRRESFEVDTTDSILVNLPNGQTLVWEVA